MENNENTGDSLDERLDRVTQEKNASAESTEQKDNSNFFSKDENDFDPEPKTKNENEESTEEKPAQRLTRDMKIASANSIIGMINITTRIFIPIHNRKFQKKFTKEEILKLDKLVYKNSDQITDHEEISLKNKFDKLIKKHNKKLENVPLSEAEEKDLQTQLIAYMDFKNKTIPPEIGLLFNAISIIGNRVVDVTTD